MAIGFTLPFSKTTGSLGHFDVSVTELQAVENNLRSLLITNWGERVMHHNFGCNLIEFLFEPMSGDEMKERITDRIVSQVGKWMPFVSVKNTEITFSDDDNSLSSNSIRIRIHFSLSNRPDTSSLFDFVVTP